MTLHLYANNASTTLSSGISSTSTSIVMATGDGALFPLPSAPGEGFFMTLTDAETQQTREIVYCTARSGDVCTVVRGQQGTPASIWGAGDIIAQLVTKGDLDGFVQPDQLVGSVYTKATSVAGTNSITATLAQSGLTALEDMMAFVVPAAAANTGAATLTLTLGATVTAAKPIKKFGNAALAAGDIPAAGYPVELVYSATLDVFVMTNPSIAQTGSVAGGAANEVLYQTSPGNTGFVAAPTVAGTVLAWTGSALAWLAAAVTSFNGRAGAVVSQAGDYTAAMVGAIARAAFTAPFVSKNNPAFQVLPDDSTGNSLVIQSGTNSVPANTLTAIPFGKIFPNRCVAVVASCNNQAAALEVDGFTTASFNVRVNANQVSWIAIGY